MNGWHRLWVAMSLIYLLFISLFTWIIYPTRNQLHENWYSDLYNFAKKNASEETLLPKMQSILS